MIRGINRVKWNSILLDSKYGGFGVGCLRSKNLSLLGKWKWRFLTEENTLWRTVIKEFYGEYGGFHSSNSSLGVVVLRMRQTPPCGSTSGVVMGRGLKISFPRLYALESFKDCMVKNRGQMVNESWFGLWDWRIPPGGGLLTI
ncbi:hypothetical protein Tco_0882295 [Tanacetum coccineum]